MPTIQVLCVPSLVCFPEFSCRDHKGCHLSFCHIDLEQEVFRRHEEAKREDVVTVILGRKTAPDTGLAKPRLSISLVADSS